MAMEMVSTFFKEMKEDTSLATIKREFTSLYTHFFLQLAFLIGSASGNKATMAAVGVAAGLGNIYYSFLAVKMKNNEKREYTALPYGIDYVSTTLLAFGAGKRGFLAVLLAGACKVILGVLFAKVKPFANVMLKYTPTVAFTLPLGTWTFANVISILALSKLFEIPVAGFGLVMLMFAVHFADTPISFLRGKPKDLHWIILGLGAAYAYELPAITKSGYKFDYKMFDDVIFDAFDGFDGITFKGFWMPMIIAAVASSLVSLASLVHAQGDGDAFPIGETLISDGAFNILGGVLGSPIMTSVQMGQPVHKKLGAKTFYTFGHGVLLIALSFSGLLTMLIDATHPLMWAPSLAIFGFMLFEQTVVDEYKKLPARYIPVITAALVMFTGSITMFNKFSYTFYYAPLWITILMHTVDRKWLAAVPFCLLCAVLSIFSIFHQSSSLIFDFDGIEWDPKTGRLQMTIAYVVLGVLFYLLHHLRTKMPSDYPEPIEKDGPKFIDGMDDWSKTTLPVSRSSSASQAL